MRTLLFVFCVLARSAFAEPVGTAAPSTSAPGQFQTLTTDTPLSQLAPVPLAPDDERIHREVDAAICASYRRWRSEGNPLREHMESWCPGGR
jgi:hypothetical protein